MSVLSKPQILKHLKGGNIVIDPFEEKNLNSTSYDVRIGKYIFRQTNLSHTQVLNPFYEKSVRAMYSKLEIAAPVENISSKTNPLYNLEPNDLIVLIAPGETILAIQSSLLAVETGQRIFLLLPPRCVLGAL